MHYRTLLTALLSLWSLTGAAQGLPELQKAPEITSGELPNGISYYLVHNDAAPGSADFAIVQPGRTDIAQSRADLSGLPDFGTRKPYRFLADAGIGYGTPGFIRHRGGNTEYRFRDVPVSDAAVTDSLLLLLFDLAREYSSRQAVAISGDIDVAAIQERIRLISMTVSQRTEASEPAVYTWKPQEQAAVTTFSAPVGMIRIMYRSPRTEREYMNTLQPVMSEVMANEFNMILERRLREAFAIQGIPMAGYRYSYSGSDDSPSDEMFSISVQTSAERLEEALGTIAGVLAKLDADGVTSQETVFVHNCVRETAVRDRQSFPMTNAQYIDKCLAAYLYGSNLASYGTLSGLFINRRLDIERERELLGRYISATITSGRNLHLNVGSKVKPDSGRVLELFREGWERGSEVTGNVPSQSDTTLLGAARKKVKLSSSVQDGFSGGKMLTFSNGISVIYKKTATKGRFEYGLMVRGGWTEIPGITGSETAYAASAASLQRVAGLSARRFSDLLAMNGISLRRDLLLSDIRYTGTAPKNKLSLTLKALLALANQQSGDPEAFKMECEAMRVRMERDKFAPAGTRAMLDSLLCPEYPYASGSMPDIPSDDFTERVAKYVSGKGAGMRGGIIVLVGDLDEATVIKHLTQLVGGFGQEKRRVQRPRIDYPLRDCWPTVQARGGWRDKGVSVTMMSSWPFSAGSRTSLDLACIVLGIKLSSAMADLGYNAEVTHESTLLPSEKMTVHIDCRPVPAGGLPEGVTPASPQKVLDAVRKVITVLAAENIDSRTLALSKARLSGAHKAEAASDAALRDNILYRNSLGRDLTGNFAERIKAVKASDVKAIFAALDACKGEFIVQ